MERWEVMGGEKGGVGGLVVSLRVKDGGEVGEGLKEVEKWEGEVWMGKDGGGGCGVDGVGGGVWW